MILGDSLLKDIEQHKIRNGLPNKDKVFVKHFSGTMSRTYEELRNPLEKLR